MSEFVLDWQRRQRTGVSEAVLADSKSKDQLIAILEDALARKRRLLVTRLTPDVAECVVERFHPNFRYDHLSHTGVIGVGERTTETRNKVAVIAAGTSDLRVAREACQTLVFNGHRPDLIVDVGVAGLWRLMHRMEEVRAAHVLIAVAGMEGALFSVLAGLVRAPVIAVPTSVGYGVAAGGQSALRSALASCAPGIVTVNIDNGFGAAVAATKILEAAGTLAGADENE